MPQSFARAIVRDISFFFAFILAIVLGAAFWPIVGLVWLVIEVRAKESSAQLTYADPVVVFIIWILGALAIVPMWTKVILPLIGAWT